MTLWRNVLEGSNWEVPTGGILGEAEYRIPRAQACCAGGNRVLIVGGNGTDQGFIAIGQQGDGHSAPPVSGPWYTGPWPAYDPLIPPIPLASVVAAYQPKAATGSIYARVVGDGSYQVSLIF